jgi:excisionase family DNA binding protein
VRVIRRVGRFVSIFAQEAGFAVVAEIELTERELDRLADRVAERVAARAGQSSPWLTASDAAVYLACPQSRIRKLTMTGELPCHRDGRRVLYRREELDAFVYDGGAVSP